MPMTYLQLVSIAVQESIAVKQGRTFQAMQTKVSRSTAAPSAQRRSHLSCTVANATLSHVVRIGTYRQDNMDGTYLVSYTPGCAGEYRVSVEFLGTFQVFLLFRRDLEVRLFSDICFHLGHDHLICSLKPALICYCNDPRGLPGLSAGRRSLLCVRTDQTQETIR